MLRMDGAQPIKHNARISDPGIVVWSREAGCVMRYQASSV